MLEERISKMKCLVALSIFVFSVVGINGALEAANNEACIQESVLPSGIHAVTNYTGDESGTISRVGAGAPSCSIYYILVDQGATEPLPNGIPTYTVEVQNVCVSGCSISNIHLSCGWFSSARLVDPSIFRRVGYDDCLVNGGEPLSPGEALSFQYANTFMYPLYVSSVAC
ncbi:TPD1 protein homolog 1-like [Primulina huaijiensis]|uniref:TPD1 protein homolog 1-like n=1 Tax=Primulina huaijiensis TaxID=1492673 RepID=UPI003CC790A4